MKNVIKINYNTFIKASPPSIKIRCFAFLPFEEKYQKPHLQDEPEEEIYYKKKFYPDLKPEKPKNYTNDEVLAGWRTRGTKKTYGASFREAPDTRDAYINRYGVAVMTKPEKIRPLYETQDPGDLDDEKYFDDKEYKYRPLKKRSYKDIPKSMGYLVRNLCKLAREDNSGLAYECVDEGADCTLKDKTGWSPLHYACDRGSLKVLEVFLRKEPDLEIKDENDFTPLMCAANNGHSELCQKLVLAGAKVNIKDKLGRTPLHLACLAKNGTTVTVLLDSGINIDEKDNDGWTALHYATYNHATEISTMLVKAKADVNSKEKNGNTPLHFAVMAGSFEICCIVTSGKNVNISEKNNDGNTALHMAAIWAQINPINSIAIYQSDFDAKNNDGLTAEDIARIKGFKKVTEALENKKQQMKKSERKSNEILQIKDNNSVTKELDVVTLHLNGRVFVTSKDTLECVYGGYFWMLFNPENEPPVLNKLNHPEMGSGPGPECKKIAENEYEIDRDPGIFHYILEFLRTVRYSPNRKIPLPDDKYELYTLWQDSKFYRLPVLAEIIKVERRSRQKKSYKNVVPERHRRRMVRARALAPQQSDFGKPYVPERAKNTIGDYEYRRWDPILDPYATIFKKQQINDNFKQSPTLED